MYSRRDFLELAAAAGLAAGCAGGRGALRGQASLGPFEVVGVDERLIREGLGAALSRGADFADLFFQHRISSVLEYADGAVSKATGSVELGVGVRAVKGDQTGYGYTEELTLESLRSAARTAAAIADGPARPGPALLRVAGGLPDRYRLRVGWDVIGVERKLPILERVAAAIRAGDRRITKVNVTLTDQHGAVLVADSRGRVVLDRQPMTLLQVSSVAEQNGRRETAGSAVAGRAGLDLYDDPTLARVARECVERTILLLDAVQAPAGEMPVVLAAGGAGVLFHEAIGHGMEADFNRKGRSIYADRIGKPIARPFVNIVDDATPEHGRGALNVDDEGNVAGLTHLVEDGRLATYLHDEISARHYRVAPTGNGRRESYRNPPLPRMRTTYMLNGPHHHDDIVASVKRGIYCSVIGGGRVQIGAGDFTFYVKNGFLIEDGRLTRPIKDVNLIGNGPKVLERIDMVANDLVIDRGGWTCGKLGQNVPVSQGMPTVRVSSLTVGGQIAGAPDQKFV